jgi:catechol 2,3-dioxygenase-like lactoylglutathione lyase family enzyme
MAVLGHVGLTVRSIEDSYVFYHEVVGLAPANQGAKEDVAGPREDGRAQFFQARSDAFDRLTNNPGSEIKYLYLESPGGFTLQLIEYLARGGGSAPLGHNITGSPHMSFFVPDVDAKRREVEERGDVKIISDVIQIAPNMRSFYVADPDGIPVEFLEVT